MKPKDLSFPFSWEERRPFLQDGVFSVPRYYQAHEGDRLPPLESDTVFGNENPIHIEYCSGNGEWVANRALENPNINWVAVERDFDRVRKIWSKKKNLEISNLLIVHGQAEDFTKYYLKKDQIAEIFINFPDPWPKKRHAKHRLIQENFIKELSCVAKPGASFSIVTDDPTYKGQVIEEVLRVPLWRPYNDYPHYELIGSEYGSSYFYRLWRELEREIYYMKFIRGKDERDSADC